MRCLTEGGIVNIEIVIYGTNHDFAGVQADADLQSRFFRLAELSAMTSRFLLHRQGSVARTQRVVLVRQRRSEESHDAVTQYLVDGSFIAMHGIHHEMQHRIDDLLRLFGIAVFDQLHRVPDVGKENGDLFPFSFQGRPRSQYLLSEMSGNVAVWRGYPGNFGCCDSRGLIYGLAANSAKRGFATARRATVRTDRFEPRPAVFAKGRISQILALTFRTNHNGNQSQMGCIAPNSIKPELSVHSKESKQCIVPGYAESKLNCFHRLAR